MRDIYVYDTRPGITLSYLLLENEGNTPNQTPPAPPTPTLSPSRNAIQYPAPPVLLQTRKHASKLHVVAVSPGTTPRHNKVLWFMFSATLVHYCSFDRKMRIYISLSVIRSWREGVKMKNECVSTQNEGSCCASATTSLHTHFCLRHMFRRDMRRLLAVHVCVTPQTHARMRAIMTTNTTFLRNRQIFVINILPCGQSLTPFLDIACPIAAREA